MLVISYKIIKILMLFLVVYGFAYGWIIFRLRKNIVKKPEVRYSGLDEIDVERQEILNLPRAWLLENGFRHIAWLQSTEIFNPEGRPCSSQPQSLYLNRDGSVRCIVAISALPQNGIPYLLNFSSTLDDGSEICTVNRAGPIPAPSGYLIEDDYLPLDEQHFAFHIKKIEGRVCVYYSCYDDLLRRVNELNDKVFSYWQSEMLVQKSGVWRLSWRGALRFVLLLKRHNQRIKDSPPPKVVAVSERALQYSESEMLRKQIEIDVPSAKASTAKAWIFVGTALAFLVLGKLFFGLGWEFIAALMVVLLFHELGHFFAMKIFGYGDLSIFFLPMIGAAASGKKDNAPPWQQLIILMAGPVPGVLLAIGFVVLAVMAITMGQFPLVLPGLSGFMLYVIVLALIVNFINLLPIMPLDGGRVVELLFFSRYPRASFGFFVVCIFALGFAASTWGDSISGVLAVVLGLSLPFQWKLMQISRVLRPHYGVCADQKSALAVLAQTFSQGVGKTWPAVTRINITKALLPRLQGGVPGLKTLILGSIAYFGVLLAPVICLLFMDPQALSSPANAVSKMISVGILGGIKSKQEHALATATTADEKIAANMALFNIYEMNGDKVKAQTHLKSAYRSIDPKQPFSNKAWQARTAYISDLLKRNPTAAMRLWDETDAVLGLPAADKNRLAEWLRFKDSLLATSGATLDERIANKQKELFVRESVTDDVTMRGVVRRELAVFFLQKGQSQRALDMLKLNLAEASVQSGSDGKVSQGRALSDLTWALISAQQPSEAIKLYENRMPSYFLVEYGDYMGETSPEQAQAYAWLALGKNDVAIDIFSHIEEQYEKTNPKSMGETGRILLLLDLLTAQQSARREDDVKITQEKLKAVMDKTPMEAHALMESISYASMDPGNMASGRAVTHLKLLQNMGYSIKKT